MKIICSGCGKHLGEKPADNFGEDAVSHGLCKKCAHHFMAQAGMALPVYLESVQEPVVMLTGQGTVSSANSKALSLLGRSPVETQGYEPGDVFECEHSYLPEGCGKTSHCNACTIRNTITDTIRTGRPHAHVRTNLLKRTESGSKQVEIMISTEKKGGVVFLKVEEISDMPA